jgi:esterase/lipase superfamily enzyme
MGVALLAGLSGATTVAPPAARPGPAALPADLPAPCADRYETPVVETWLQGWRVSGLVAFDCLGRPLDARQTRAALRALPRRGPLPVEAIDWSNGLHAVRIGGRLVYLRDDGPIVIGVERKAIVAGLNTVRGADLAAAPPPPPPPDAPPPQDGRVHQVRVHYGTDREVAGVSADMGDPALGLTGPATTYSSRQGAISYGTALVTLPPRHERGELERPQWWRLEFTADPQRHVTFRRAVAAPTREAFMAQVRETVAASREKQAFVFVHGFNTGFEAAALRTAQMHHDLGFDGAPIFWSWASKGRPDPVAYFADTRAAARTVEPLTVFLRQVAEESGAARVHVIAHSMGNQATVRALNTLAARAPGAGALFDQVVLCSPDVDRAEFERVAAAIQSTARRTTLYASANDKALEVSAVLNGGRRLGDASGGVVTAVGLESVDASKVTTDLFSLNHTFFSSVPSVMTDLRQVLATRALPPERGLLEVRPPEQPLPWWAIP